MGRLLIQMAKLRGAEVITTVSTGEKAEIAMACGADHVIMYTQESFSEAVKGITDGKGVQVAYDAVGATTFDESIASLAIRGCMVAYGQASGPVPPVPLATLNPKSLFLTRPTLVSYTLSRDEIAMRSGQVFSWIKSGELKLSISQTFPLSDAPGGAPPVGGPPDDRQAAPEAVAQERHRPSATVRVEAKRGQADWPAPSCVSFRCREEVAAEEHNGEDSVEDRRGYDRQQNYEEGPHRGFVVQGLTGRDNDADELPEEHYERDQAAYRRNKGKDQEDSRRLGKCCATRHLSPIGMGLRSPENRAPNHVDQERPNRPEGNCLELPLRPARQGCCHCRRSTRQGR